MERVAVIGRSGGGKSMLARALAGRLGVPAVHLDALWWRPGWVEGDAEEFRARVEAALAGGRWVADGGYHSRAGDLVLGGADAVVWVDLPRAACLWRVLRRTTRWRGRVRPDMAAGCPERFSAEFARYLWNWDRDTRPSVEAALARYAGHAEVVRLRSDREVAGWLAGVA